MIEVSWFRIQKTWSSFFLNITISIVPPLDIKNKKIGIKYTFLVEISPNILNKI